MNKKQIILIHGGDTFDTYGEYLKFLKDWKLNFDDYKISKKDWKSSLSEKLGPDFEVIRPDMPNKINAKYAEWKIWFEKFIPHLEEEVIFVGHSLGGTFLAKYLSENKLKSDIKGIFLIAPCFDDKDSDYSLADFKLSNNLGKIEKQCGDIYLYHSKDDPVVSFSNAEKFKEAVPGIKTIYFKDRGHFFGQEEFPELIKDIVSLN